MDETQPHREHSMSDKPFVNLVETHGATLFAYLWRMTRSEQDAEDCLQETFLRAYRAYPRLRQDSNPRAWLYAIATNVARTHLRRARRHSAHRAEVDPETLRRHGPSIPESFLHAELLQAIARAVDALPHKQRAALIMRKYQGLSYEAIGSVLGCSPAAARADVYQGLKKLRARFTACEESRS